jgi:hypothetical protein
MVMILSDAIKIKTFDILMDLEADVTKNNLHQLQLSLVGSDIKP